MTYQLYNPCNHPGCNNQAKKKKKYCKLHDPNLKTKKQKNAWKKVIKKHPQVNYGGVSVTCPECHIRQGIPPNEFYRAGGGKCIVCGAMTIRNNPSRIHPTKRGTRPL